MRRLAILSRLLVAAAVMWGVFCSPVVAQQVDSPFPAQHRRAVEQNIREYLLQNPEFLREVSAELERRGAEEQKAQQAKVLEVSRERLISARGGIVLGNAKGSVTLVVFFDYNCPFCRASVDDVQALIQSNPDLRVVIKEFPILGPESIEASRVALAVGRQFKDAEVRSRYYRTLMKTKGRMNGDLALSSAAKFGVDVAKARGDLQDNDIDAMIRENLTFAESAGINGTPAFIVGYQIIMGAVGVDAIRDAISKAPM